jgi:hypothetical protein
MHSHARTSAKIDATLFYFAAFFLLCLSPEMARRSSQKNLDVCLMLLKLRTRDNENSQDFSSSTKRLRKASLPLFPSVGNKFAPQPGSVTLLQRITNHPYFNASRKRYGHGRACPPGGCRRAVEEQQGGNASTFALALLQRGKERGGYKRVSAYRTCRRRLTASSSQFRRFAGGYLRVQAKEPS